MKFARRVFGQLPITVKVASDRSSSVLQCAALTYVSGIVIQVLLTGR